MINFKRKPTGMASIQNVFDDMPKNVPLASALYRDKWKRSLDLAVCIPVSVLAAVPMLITAIAIKAESKGPVLFRQKRLGLNGEEFEILKFRSMCVGAEKMGSGVYSNAGDSRVTRVGSRLSTKEQKKIETKW